MTTDLLVENTHFIKYQISAADLGFKSLSVNLSDIAAMGGKTLLCISLHGLACRYPVKWIDEFIAGFAELAEKAGVLLLGGDTTRSNLVAVNVLIIGEIETSLIKRRSQAKPGDLICCTGFLGDSGGGLKILQEKLPQEGVAKELMIADFRPQPQLAEGVWLARQPGVHAMMDVSDGVSSDIRRIMEESLCGAHLEVEKLPISENLRKASEQFGWQAEDLALSAGEDYCLLLTVDPSNYDALKTGFSHQFHRSLHQIGTILPGPELTFTFHNKVYVPSGTGFDHFKSG